MRYYFSRFVRFLHEGAIPLTKSILVLAGLVFVGSHFFNLRMMLGLTPAYLPGLFWTFITFPLVNTDFLSLVFAGLWLWFVGGSLERTWGYRIYGFFVILVVAVTGGAMSLAAIIVGKSWFQISGLWLPLVGITWAWAKIYPEREVMIWGVFPVKALWLAWINAGVVFFNYLRVDFLLALATLSGIILVYLFGDTGRLGRGLNYRSWRREGTYSKSKRNRLRIIK
ncbi:MAG: DUF1751 domain-containing protein [Firmicutes bacterium]|nr:DUF1751 domain-containing protein [Bacillota bacterium]